jgi:hypothetical protein
MAAAGCGRFFRVLFRILRGANPVKIGVPARLDDRRERPGMHPNDAMADLFWCRKASIACRIPFTVTARHLPKPIQGRPHAHHFQ